MPSLVGSEMCIRDRSVSFRDCVLGEIYQKYSTYTECYECPYNKYTFDFTSCYDCPEGAICYGGTNLEVRDGYWRSSNMTANIISCKNKKSNCLQSTGIKNEICKEGHIGPLCEECDINGEYWGEKYNKSGTLNCLKCSKKAQNYMIFVLVAAWCIISLKLGATKNIELEELRIKVLNMDINDSTYQENKTKLQASSDTLLKILQNYLLIVSSIASFDLPIPSGISETPSATGQPIKQSMYSMDCIIVEINSSVPFLYRRFLFGLLLPFIYIAIYFIISASYSFVKKQPVSLKVISTSLLYYFIFLQPDLVHQMLGLISCRTIDSKNYIQSDLTKECYTSEFYRYAYGFIGPLLVVFIFLIPALLLSLIHI
eukprot:TRINITY_DN2884_c0_g1_i1.p1 TRINITY_DN2884_c0_g1~~TRINITY_DN2884_c0_g1_i1.p1  ORF type:complete len:371 (+),score=42.15 TRINITY_DN2884_c0_g1_i1:95-1207(+)